MLNLDKLEKKIDLFIDQTSQEEFDSLLEKYREERASQISAARSEEIYNSMIIHYYDQGRIGEVAASESHWQESLDILSNQQTFRFDDDKKNSLPLGFDTNDCLSFAA